MNDDARFFAEGADSVAARTSMERRDFLRIAGVAGAVLIGGSAGRADEPPISSQPATQPERSTSSRRPVQEEILDRLLKDRESPKPILPQKPESGAESTELKGADGASAGLLLEGTVLVKRPGRLLRTGEQSEFAFTSDETNPSSKTLTILPSQLLEAMEQEAASGVKEFEITAEVTRYRGRNYLMLRKVLRRVPNGNLSP